MLDSKKFTHILWMLGFMWCLYFISIVTSIENIGGIKPRELSSVFAIFSAPFLHGGLLHIISNSIPFLVLGYLSHVRQNKFSFFELNLFIIIFSGLMVWLFARSGNHLGASGLIFGYLGYLMAIGITTKTIKDILISVGVFVVYGGMVFGVLPSKPYISWEAHLFGFVSGIMVARMEGFAQRRLANA